MNNVVNSVNVKFLILCLVVSVTLNMFLLQSNDEDESNCAIKNIVRQFTGVENLEISVPSLSPEILDYHRRLNLTSPGHMGLPVILPKDLPPDIQAEVNQSINEFKFNEFLSRLIPLDRELPDYRQGTCLNVTYLPNIPKVSVVIAFYNEPFTMLMRTVFSILNRSPAELIEEIVLVDDCSDKGNFRVLTVPLMTRNTFQSHYWCHCMRFFQNYPKSD